MSELRELLIAHVGYSAWAMQETLRACALVAPEQRELDCGASHASILKTLRHVHDGERVWLRRLVVVDDDRLPRGAAPEHSFEHLVASWPELWRGYREWVEAASDKDLVEVVVTVLPDDEEFRVPRWQIVLHAINHSTHHRGQIITMLRGFGVQPPNTDLTNYYATR